MGWSQEKHHDDDELLPGPADRLPGGRRDAREQPHVRAHARRGTEVAQAIDLANTFAQRCGGAADAHGLAGRDPGGLRDGGAVRGRLHQAVPGGALSRAGGRPGSVEWMHGTFAIGFPSISSRECTKEAVHACARDG